MSTTTERAVAPDVPDAIAAAAGSIADRLRTKSIDQVIAIGERTGWWTEALVDWVAGGREGPPPDVLLEAAHTSSVPRPPSPLTAAPATPVEVELPSALQEHVLRPAEPPVPDATDPAAEPSPSSAMDAVAAGDPGDVAEDHHAGSAYVAVLQARELGVDHSYQRPLDEHRVAGMVADWNPRMVGTIHVSDRGTPDDGGFRYAVLDGQQRAVAAARVSPAGPDVWLACTVHEGLDVAGEAKLMHELDRTSKKLTGWDKWHARRGAGDPIVLQVEAIAARHGLKVTNEPGDGCLRSYGAAEKLLQRGGENLLDATLTILRGAYGLTFSGYQAPLLTGVGQLLQVYGDTVDGTRLTRALATARPEQLRAAATALRDVEGGALHELMTRAIIGQYNRTPGHGPRLGGRA